MNANHIPAPRCTIFSYDPGPPIQANIRTIKIEHYAHRFDQVLTKKGLQKYAAKIQTMYKRKDKKIRPVNMPLSDGINPQKVTPVDVTDLKVVPRGSQLTSEQIAAMNVGIGFLSTPEKQLFIDILLNYEGAIAFRRL